MQLLNSSISKMKQSSACTIVPMMYQPPPRRGQDMKFIIFISFAAGLLIGIPLTYCLMSLPFMKDYQQDFTDISHSVIKEDLIQIFTKSHSNSRTTSSPTRNAPVGKVIEGQLPVVSSLLVKTNHHKRKPNISREAWFAQEFHLRPELESSTRQPQYILSDLVDGVFWTPISERLVPKGFDDYDIRLWKRFVNSTDVVRVQQGCGRMQNRLLTLAEGTKSCCRYRHNNDQIQGEIFSFYLGRILGLRNLWPSTLSLVDPRTKRWSTAASQIALAQWSYERPVVLTQFVDDLYPAYVPRQFRVKNKRRLHPISDDLKNLTSPEISELVQWTDLVLFDYLIGNLDRAVNNLYNERWNSDMMNQPTHNLAKTKQGLLIFLDNESGLLHGYRLLEKYEHLHRAILDGLCIFRKETVAAIESLHRGGVAHLMKKAFEDYDPGMSEWLPFLPDKNIKILMQRISHVHQHVRTCKARFENSATVLEAPNLE